MVLRGIFGPKRDEERGRWCGLEYLGTGGSERRMLLRGIFVPKREEEREG